MLNTALPSWQKNRRPRNAQGKQASNSLKRRKLTVDRTELSKTFQGLVGKENTFFVVIGKPQVEFELLCDTFFPRAAIFRRTPPETWNKDNRWYSVKLKEEDPSIFADYARCVYFAIVPALYGDIHVQQAHINRLFKLYLLAHRLVDLKVANLVIDEIYTCIQRMDEAPKNTHINMVFECTEPGNPLRALLRDMTVYNGSLEDWPNVRPRSFHRLFSEDILIELMDVKHDDTGLTVEEAFGSKVLHKRIAECYYHLHDQDTCLNCTQSRPIPVAELIASRRASFR